MRLVKLEIKGFKSFAKETILHFSEDVIGVVGPNGSGKSNIVDAIRWVLGEQKKGELRLDKMSSVIFNGTKHRKAGNVAQVFLTFDNDRGVLRTDFQTITIGRLLYRNGDSEYRLNNVPCRRKDITDLFVDTGIESNSYAIIALGMVDDILADNDNSRLRMLEQAAGISVYKLRKRETLSRLDRTQEDLDRVQDLLFEIDGQLGELEKQARRTKKYFELKETYRELSLDYAYLSSQHIGSQTQEVAQELERAEAFAKTKATHLAELEASVETQREHLLAEEQHIAEQRRQLGVIQGKLRQAVNDRQLAEQQLAYVLQNRDKLLAQQDHLQQERTRLTALAAKHYNRLAQAQTEQIALREQLAAAETEHQRLAEMVHQLRSEVKARALALQAAERDVLEADRAVAITQSKLEGLQQDSAARARRAEQDQARAATQQAEFADSKARATQILAQLQRLEQEESQRLVDEERVRYKLDEIAPQLRELRSQQQRADNEAALLRSMLDKLEGSPESVRYLANKQGWKGKYQLLSDLLDIEEAYRPAIEAVLADVLSCYVVPDAATAAEGLRVLAEAAQPVVKILYNPVAASAKPLATSRQLPTHARWALEVVRVPKAYQGLVQTLLHGVIITNERLDPQHLQAHEAAVDRSGAQVWTRETAEGGTRGKLLGRLTGRRQKLTELETNIEALAVSISALDAERIALEQALRQNRAAHNPNDIKQLRQRLGEAERLVASAQARIESFDLQQEERARLDREALARIEQLRTDLQQATTAREPLYQHWQLLQQAHTSGDEASEEATAVLAKASSSYNAANLAAIQHDNLITSLTRELGYAEDQLAEVVRTAEEAERALGSDGTEIGQLRERIDALAQRIAEGKTTRDEHDTRLQAREQEFSKGRATLTEDEKSVRHLQRETIDAAALESRLRERKAELSFRMEALADRLRIEFNLDLHAALAEPRNVTTSLAEQENQLSRQKNRLDNYGEINPLAVEAYDTMSERRMGIFNQQEDIVAAMDDLRQTVAEIDRNATDQLLAAFEAVRGHFVDVFRHLFDAEDTADMIMLDPENPLESKIEIIAKPKGKRPQSISQLSGGEKTLTATAFLFALYLIKPAPFCIFDEVDAPLDDTNVEKFNRIIKRFSGESQFIIVTHNKLTMAAVDTIYGVYMPELGVSQVTQVDFRDFEHTDVLEMVG